MAIAAFRMTSKSAEENAYMDFVFLSFNGRKENLSNIVLNDFLFRRI